MRTLLACCLLVAAAGCPSVNTDPGETGSNLPPLDGPTVQFDPSNNIVPFPNNLVRVNGKVALPAQCGETAAATAARMEINQLDGFGTYESSLTATFTSAPDPTSLDATDVVLYERLHGGSAVDPSTAQSIPAKLITTKTQQFSVDCSSSTTVDELVVIPELPLDEQSTYVAAILDGAKAADGTAFIPSFVWALVRQPDDPVTLDGSGNVIAEQTPLDPSQGSAVIAELQGIDQLWQAHHAALQFLAGAGHTSDTVLVAWEFTTQTTTDPLDATIAGTPAANVSKDPLGTANSILGTGVTSQCAAVGLAAPCTAEDFLNVALGAGACTKSGGFLPCNAIADIGVGVVQNANYQTLVANPLAGGAMLPAAWDDPVHPTVQNSAVPLQYITFTPAVGCPPSGCPLVVFGHGLGSSKESMFAIAPTLAAAGFAGVAIDFVNSGGRGIQISNSAALACDGSVSATANHQCFASILSTDLAQTRDNFRQSILDVRRLTLGAEACGAGGCGILKVDPAHVTYAGISLGGILGTLETAVTDFNVSLLNVPGVGWLDILENTGDPADISCPLVDALIDAGILTGDKSNSTYDKAGNVTVTTGLCLDVDQATGIYSWREQPGYQQFQAIGRWMLDPGDPANFIAKVRARKVLEEEVIGDLVVSNVAGTNEGELLGLTAGSADPLSLAQLASPPPPPTASVATATTSTWLQYHDVAGTGSADPGIAYEHASLLRPSDKTGNILAGVLGTVRLQTDGVTFLFNNK
jgi:hypothetical protein|nr:hypothetical protein [Kofleriaceae bacterium]